MVLLKELLQEPDEGIVVLDVPDPSHVPETIQCREKKRKEDQKCHSLNDFKATLLLAFQSIGVIYGDMGTSPLYVFSSVFERGIENNDDILGVFSLIIYTIILSPIIKYMFFVLHANDKGNGGTFALYSLLSRYAKIGSIPNQQAEGRELSNYNLHASSNGIRAQKIKEKVENSELIKVLLLVITILGVSLVIGDGILTPCISVLSAVSGIKRSATSLNQDAIVGISVAILIVLFTFQQLGTNKVGYVFAPIIFVWLSFIGVIGIYNVCKYDPRVFRAFNPKYVIEYFHRNGKEAWISLGGVVLSITGTEAMFADLGHFSVQSVQISFCGIVFPALLCAYSGQAAYLQKNPHHVLDTFYDSIPDSLYWPAFIIAVCAAIIASQAMISGVFQIISQATSLGCFPRIKVVHTSEKHEGQVYIPEVNYLLMISCLIITISFQTTEQIGNAYGITVIGAECITTFMVSLVMLIIWKLSIWKVAVFCIVFGAMELTYLTAVLYKFTKGGYIPVAISLVLVIIMGIWHYVHKQRYVFELMNIVSSDYVRDVALDRKITRVSGIAFFYTDHQHGIPPIFPHFVSRVSSIHSVLVFISVKYVHMRKVEDRFVFHRVQPKDYQIFRCMVHCGYGYLMDGSEKFEQELIQSLKNFIGGNMKLNEASTSNNYEEMEEMEFIQKASEEGVVHLMEEIEVLAQVNSSMFKKFAVNNVYNFLSKCFRQGDALLSIPRTKLLRIGMAYEI